MKKTPGLVQFDLRQLQRQARAIQRTAPAHRRDAAKRFLSELKEWLGAKSNDKKG